MDPTKLFRTELFLLRLFGFQLEYKRTLTDFLLILLASFSIFCIFLLNLFLLHNLFFGNLELEDFSDVFGCICSTVEVFVKIPVFYLWSYKLKKLYETMVGILESGNSMSVKRHDEVAKSGRRLLVMQMFVSTFTSTSIVLGAVFRNINETERVLPFQIR